MKQSLLKKSSFTLPISEIPLVASLKKKFRLKSNTDVIRMALHELDTRINRETLRKKFAEASQLVRQANQKEMTELDELADEGLPDEE